MDEWVQCEIMHDVIMRSDDFATYFKQLGRMAARIHNQASQWDPPANFRRHSLDADGLMGTFPWWGQFWEATRLTESERLRFKHLREAIHGRLSELDKHRDTYSMIHADLAPGNLVINEGNLDVIDFDDATFGWHIYELATGVYPYQEHPRFPEMISAVFEGYRELRPLNAASASLLKIFMLIRALSLIGWRAARPELLNQPEWSRGSKWTINKALSLSADIGL